jgi:hypothetical protein
VFYGGGGITPDIEVKEPSNTPARASFAPGRQILLGISGSF